MAYTRPMVMVFQEYASTSISTPSAQLPPCIVGPCYHIIDNVEDETLALYGQYAKEGIDSGFIPNNAPGALIEADSVKIRIKNAIVSIASGVAVQSSSMNGMTFADSSILEKLEIGDYVEFSDVSDPLNPVVDAEQLRVYDFNIGANTLLLNRSVPTISENTRVAFYRKLDEVVFDKTSNYVNIDVTSEKFSLIGAKAAVADGEEYLIVGGEVYVGYRALRQDVSSIATIYDVNEIEGKLGKICPENPLALGVSIAMANASIGIKYVGVDSNDLAGYTAAKDKLETEDPCYAIVPLTMDAGILSMFKNHAVEMSDPKRGMWRIAIGCCPLVTTKKIAEGRVKLSKDGDGDFVVATDVTTESSYLSNDMDAGDALYIIDKDGVEHRYTISSVPSEDIFTITQSEPFDEAVFTLVDSYNFYVMKTLDKLNQAREVANTSKSYGTHRFINIFPDVCIIDDKEVPGYYLGCAVAGGIGGLPSHYGFTRLSVSGISGLKHSSNYFNNDQLDVMADGGTFIFVQNAQAAAPFIRHQLTCDRSTLEFQELSYVKNFDYISYICRDVMDTYLGKYNINASTLQILHTALNATLKTLTLDTTPRIGSRVINYNIISVQQHEDIRDRVEMYAELTMPYPLNTIGLHLISK